MLRKFKILVVAVLLLGFFTPMAKAANPPENLVAAKAVDLNIQAKAAILVDMASGQVLWSKQGDEPMEPASTTKILTALLALDIADLAREYTVTKEAAQVGESSVHLQVGEIFTLENLLTAALVKSANDACFAIGQAVAGSEPIFVNWMNLKAEAIGAYSSSIKNTNGLPNADHKMSCYDLALIARMAMEQPKFAELVASKTAVMYGGNYNRSLKNTNKFLQTNPEVIGIKTGTTDNAGACLVSAMAKNGRKVIAVVLHSPDRYGESLRLLNYGIANFVNYSKIPKGTKIAYYPDQNSKEGGTWVLAANADLATVEKNADGLAYKYYWRNQMPRRIKAGQVLGTACLEDASNLVYSRVNLVAAETLTYHPFKEFVWQLKTKLFAGF